MQGIWQINEIVKLDSKEDVLRLHLYIKLLQNGIKPHENDIKVLAELYFFGGYNNPEEQLKFIELCIAKKYKKSDQSVRNTLSLYTGLGVLEKPRNSVLHLSENYIKKIDCEKLVLLPAITHLD